MGGLGGGAGGGGYSEFCLLFRQVLILGFRIFNFTIFCGVWGKSGYFCGIGNLQVFFFYHFHKKVREKSRECHNHKTQPFPDPKRKRKTTNPNKHKSNKRTKSTKISSLFPKRGNRKTKRTVKHKNKMTHGKTYNKSPRRISHKARKSETNTGTTALKRSVE